MNALIAAEELRNHHTYIAQTNRNTLSHIHTHRQTHKHTQTNLAMPSLPEIVFVEVDEEHQEEPSQQARTTTMVDR